MPNLFAGVSLALQSVLSHQAAVEVIEHNVANVNTPGYRRQEAALVSGPAIGSQGASYNGGLGQFGTGVSVDKIRRFNTDYYDTRYRSEIQSASQYNLKASILRQLEAEFSETSTAGLLNKLDEVWSTWQKLSADPSNTALRAELVDVANTFTQAINGRALSIYQLQAEQNLQVSQRVSDINEKAEQVARLNGEIMRVISIDEQPNDLMDQRDVLLDELAKLTGATSTKQPAGDVIVSINGHVLVQGVDSFRLVSSADPANHNFTRITWEDGQNLVPRSGELAGLFDARDGVLNDQMDALDDLSASMITRINQLHQSGFAPGKTAVLSTIPNTITGFGSGVLDVGQTELASSNHFVETRWTGTDWQFRVVDSTGTPESVQLSDGSGYSANWQNIPVGTGSSVQYDTGRGLSVTFGGDPAQYAAATFGAGAAGVSFTQQQDFFSGTDALTIAINPMVLNNPNLVASAVTPNAPGDGELARMIANVRSETLMNGGLSTINQFYNSQTARFGLEVSRAVSNAKDRSLVAGAIDGQRMSIAGVNLNEEAANLVKAQKAFEASARLMTVIDQMLDTIINGMGLVGR